MILLIAAFIGGSVWLVDKAANPPQASYLVLPEKYGQLSTRGAKVTDETWTNRDGTSARGWLLRGTEGRPAVILMHRYGADRSWVLNLAVKLNESTDFTVLMPDLRGHGENPHVKHANFGHAETEDTLAALDYLRSLKSETSAPLVGPNIGVYGIELGAYAGLMAAAKDQSVKALALDSVPKNSDGVLKSAIAMKYPFMSSVTSKIASVGAYGYFFREGYDRVPVCNTAQSLQNTKVLLLAGVDMPEFADSTSKLATCFSSQIAPERKLDLNPSGYNVINTSLEQSGPYDERVIDFFRRSL